MTQGGLLQGYWTPVSSWIGSVNYAAGTQTFGVPKVTVQEHESECVSRRVSRTMAKSADFNMINLLTQLMGHQIFASLELAVKMLRTD
jgi:hypothetical protein